MKKLRFALYFVCAAGVLSVPAFAYVDPSVTTFVWTAVVAVVVAAAATIGAFLRKAKKKAQQVLNIDENAGKKLEDELVVFDESEKAEVPAEKTGEAVIEEETEELVAEDGELVAEAGEDAAAEVSAE